MRVDGNVRFPYYNASSLDISTPEVGTSMLSRRVEHKLPIDTTPHPRRTESFPLTTCFRSRHINQEMHKLIISVYQVVCNVKLRAYFIQNRAI
jgi:hypothetical protein